MPKPKAKPAAEAADDTVDELPAPAESQDVEFTYGDITVTIPRDADDWPTRAELCRIKAAQTGTLNDWLSFYENLLGPLQWQMVVNALKRGEFFEFTRQFSEAIKKECTV